MLEISGFACNNTYDIYRLSLLRCLTRAWFVSDGGILGLRQPRQHWKKMEEIKAEKKPDPAAFH